MGLIYVVFFPVMADLLGGGKDFRNSSSLLPSEDEFPSGASYSECGSSELTSTSESCGLTEKLPHQGV